MALSMGVHPYNPPMDEARKASRPTIGVTMGDPLGIGPEVIVKALSDPAVRRGARWMLYASASVMHEAAQEAGIDPFWWQVGRRSALVGSALAQDVVLLDAPVEGLGASRCPTRAGGEASFRAVEDAIEDAKRDAGDAMRLDAIVTGPISKEAWALAGRAKYPGHTELLATRFGAKQTRMMFVAPEMRVILVTAHVPLMDLRNRITIGRVSDTIHMAREACERLGVARPRLAVCGLNPHAGEAGLLGDEEQRIITPAIRLAREAGIEASGPFPADTVFNAARRGAYDIVVAMYHDQGLIPVKLLAFDRAVNVTAGLPTVRTSPDHGTAYDIAGRNLADPGSMREAMLLATRLARTPEAAPAR